MNMKKSLTGFSIAAFSLLLIACASQPTTSLAIQNAQNQYEVIGLGKTAIIAKNQAIQAANKTCGKNSTAILVKEDAQYHGAFQDVVDPQTEKMIKAASKVLGQMAGTDLGLAGDEDYQSTLTFTCSSK